MWLRKLRELLSKSSAFIRFTCPRCGKEFDIRMDRPISALAEVYRHLSRCGFSDLTLEQACRWVSISQMCPLYDYAVWAGETVCKVCGEVISERWSVHEIRRHFITRHPRFVIKVMREKLEEVINDEDRFLKYDLYLVFHPSVVTSLVLRSGMVVRQGKFYKCTLCGDGNLARPAIIEHILTDHAREFKERILKPLLVRFRELESEGHEDL